MSLSPRLDRQGIEAIIPHREPFIFVDEIVELS
jgi:3-hydroxymyristoyl/3-hydroxydecanoyl-(acyl carrier protein) dehydratase